MTISEEILAIANQVANEGKQPSVALIKARLTKTVPLPTIIKILKTWQHDPAFTSVNTENEQEKANNETKTNELSATIERALSPVLQELKEIKALLQDMQKET